MVDHRSQAQFDFDYAKHGWSFCNKEMLRKRIEQCDTHALALSPIDKRHDELNQMKQALGEMK